MNNLSNDNILLKFRAKYNFCSGLVWLVLAGAVALGVRSAWAVPEADLAVAFDGQVRPFVQANFVTGSFSGTDGLTVRFRKRGVAHAVGTVLVVGGRTEFNAKYDELLYDLRDLPVTFFVLDHRGQGLSDRMLADANKGHVVSFDDYVFDMSTFVDTVVSQETKGPLIVIAHSMGGLVSALYANSHPDSVQGLVLCAPMMGIKTAPLPSRAARILAQGASLFGLGGRYVLGGRPYDPEKSFSANDVTRSEVRFALNKRLVAESPDNALGSPTFEWVNQAFAGMDRLAMDHKKLVMPVLLLQAGSDKVVQNAPQAEFCHDLPDCTLVTLPDAGHEILMERDAIRDSALKKIRDFVGKLILTQPGGGR